MINVGVEFIIPLIALFVLHVGVAFATVQVVITQSESPRV